MIFPVVPRREARHFPGQFLFLLRRLSAKPRADAVGTFERRIAERCGVPHGIAFDSARSACRALLEALDYPRGATLLLPALNYPAIPQIVNELGLRILWIPQRPTDLSPVFDAIPSKELKDAVALIWPHYYGVSGPLNIIEKFCRDSKLSLIEDCAHAIGAQFRRQPVGSFGRAAFFSFETSKPINTFGGGVVVTGDSALADRLTKKINSLPPPSMRDTLRGIVKSYSEAAAVNRWAFSLTLYPIMWKAKMRGDEDFLDEGIRKFALHAMKRYSVLQAEAGLRHLDNFDTTLIRLRSRWAAIHSILTQARLAYPLHPDIEPNGYMTVGLHSGTAQIAAAFYRRGIDVKRHYMRDCQRLGFGIGGERCAPISESLFHIPVCAGMSEQAFAHYLSVIRSELERLNLLETFHGTSREE